MAKIIIIGGGAAGMFASVFLAEKGHQVHVFEKNEKLGVKLSFRDFFICVFQSEALHSALHSQMRWTLPSAEDGEKLEYFRTPTPSTGIRNSGCVAGGIP